MNIQERYNDIVEISGLSEQIVRRVLKATQQSLINSLKQGKNATLPGVCTLYPEMRSKIDRDNGKIERGYVKIKAKPSSALESSFGKIDNFEEKPVGTDDGVDIDSMLNLMDPGLHGKHNTYTSNNASDVMQRYKTKEASVRVSQIGSLL